MGLPVTLDLGYSHSYCVSHFHSRDIEGKNLNEGGSMGRYLLMIACLMLLGVLFVASATGAQKIMNVQVREGQLRATPSHLGAIVSRLPHGNEVTLVESRGDWRKVFAEGGKSQGWMHVSALTSKKITLKPGENIMGRSVTHDEIALAGKGFSEDVENSYRTANKNLDYTWIDRMESVKASPEQMSKFIDEGGLITGLQGGAL
jgi:hypothetical protein